MAHTKVTGTRPVMIWGVLALVVILVVGLIVGLVVIYPSIQADRADAEATARAQAELERHYQAGVAFEAAGEWEMARAEYVQVIAIDASYEDAQTRLAEVRARLGESVATATAAAVAQAGQAQATADAEATAQAQATAEAQANEAATAAAAPTATAQALEQRYTRALGLVNLEQWVEAQEELQAIFDLDPNYKDVQTQLGIVNTELARLTPTATPTSFSTPSPTGTPALAATATPTYTPKPAIVQSSYFKGTNKGGWTVTRGGLFENPGAGGSGGGANNGCLIWGDKKDGTSYYVAPAKFHGDWRGYSELRFDLWSVGGDYESCCSGVHGDVYLVSGRATAQRLLPHRPPERWQTFVVPLKDDGEWIFGGGATRLEDILANVTDLQIRAEYGRETDESGLDNVELVQ